jgi:hypothetical protein
MSLAGLSSLVLCLEVSPELTQVKHLSSAPQVPGHAHKHLKGWKGLLGTNTLAYYKYSLIVAVKSFITLDLIWLCPNLNAATPTAFSTVGFTEML